MMSSSSRKNGDRIFLVDPKGRFVNGKKMSLSLNLRSDSRLIESLKGVDRSSIWITPKSKQTEELVRILANSDVYGVAGGLGSLLMLEPPRSELLSPLTGWFHRVIGETKEFRTLPPEELVEILSTHERHHGDVFIGGSVDDTTQTVSLVRDNLDRVTVPFHLFPGNRQTEPNFQDFELDDYGRTLRFGTYEAASDFVLWEIDADYRRRTKARERKIARGFGPSTRRLRIQRGLKQSDFPGISRKTIRRIENGEVIRPRPMTVRIIAQTLGVDESQIESY